MSRVEVKLAGAGGQGLITAGVLLAEAALLEGKRVVQAQSYGPEARLGSSSSDVIISDEEMIFYPKVQRPDIMVLMSDESYRKFAKLVRPGGILIVDKSFVPEAEPANGARLYHVPLTLKAKESVGLPVVANVLALGFLSGLTGVVKLESLAEAVKDFLARKAKYIPFNLKALEVGFRWARELSSS
ncbi:2-oxoacid:ferredoxin oxidoreductase subunit gamma [Candidatus Bathyarchaeota archaeon]|nr:MAG: 2-oxoacid:ferredoxin oxidoreductase subunit gamma [Candidatus Bathyarchaeota archaeon]